MIKKLLLIFIILFAFLNPVYSAEISLSWDYDHTIPGNESVKFRIYGKKVASTTYVYTTPMWDSKTRSNPQIHTATITITDGENYNFVSRAYNEVVNPTTKLTEAIESIDSNEVTFTAPAFVVSGLVLGSFLNSEKYEKPVYFGATGVNINMSWTPLSGATYEYRLYDIIKKYYTLSGSTSAANATFKIPKTGCYEFEVRAVRSNNYSEWKKLDSRIIGWVASTGPIVIGK